MVLVISTASAFLLQKGRETIALIYQEGSLINSIDLSAVTEPYTLSVLCEAGANTVAVESGRIRVADADCSDRLCVSQGWIGSGAIPIVCLPHRFVIQLSVSDAPEVDAIVR